MQQIRLAHVEGELYGVSQRPFFPLVKVSLTPKQLFPDRRPAGRSVSVSDDQAAVSAPGPVGDAIDINPACRTLPFPPPPWITARRSPAVGAEIMDRCVHADVQKDPRS
jgi:hypothetical protein